MTPNKLSIKILVATIIFFAISYVASKLAPVQSPYSYPFSIFKSYSRYFGNVYPVSLKSSVQATPLEEINIGVINTDVEIIPVSTPHINIIFKGKYFNVPKPNNIIRYSVTNKKLLLLTNEQSKNPHINYEGELILEIPKSVKRIIYRSQFSDLKIQSANLDQLMAQTINGDINVVDTKCNTLQTLSVTGDVTFRGEAQKLLLGTVSGDTKISLNNNNPALLFKSNSGDLDLRFHGLPDVTVNFTTVNGSLQLDRALGIYEDKRNAPFRLGAGRGSLFFNTVSGDVRISRF